MTTKQILACRKEIIASSKARAALKKAQSSPAALVHAGPAPQRTAASKPEARHPKGWNAEPAPINLPSMTLEDFARACRDLERAGFTVRSAEYHGQVFGNWAIEFARRRLAPHCLLWDGKESWLLLQSQGADGKWEDRWLAREPQHQSVESAMARIAAVD